MATARELKQQVEQRSDIVQIVRHFEPLKKHGAEYRCLCPFHSERTPSFMVSPAKQIFKCFGCGAGGDAIAFVMQHQKIQYIEALQLIASIQGIQYTMDDTRSGGGVDKVQTPRKTSKFVEKDVISKTLNHYALNPFAVWLAGIIGWERTLEVLIKFYVGTAKKQGTIFWQVDQFMRVRTGQKIHYGTDGHRLKDVDIKRLYTQKDGYEPCIFGEHQLLGTGPDTVVAVVESEKTAVICDVWQPCGPGVVYMASVGMQGLTEDKIWALRGMRVCLVPDFSFVSRATWGIVPMRKKLNEKGRLVPHPDGEVDSEFVSISQKLQKHGCNVSFFDPFPERTDGADIADVLVGQPVPPRPLAAPLMAGLTLEEQPFE